MVDYGDSRLPDRFWDKVFPEPMSGCWLWGAHVPPVRNSVGQHEGRPSERTPRKRP